MTSHFVTYVDGSMVTVANRFFELNQRPLVEIETFVQISLTLVYIAQG